MPNNPKLMSPAQIGRQYIAKVVLKESNRRLTKLADLLETVPEEQFALSEWWNPAKPSCGTVGCAGGWAANTAWFKERGLKLRRPRDLERGFFYVSYKDQLYEEALAEFFGLPQEKARQIFVYGDFGNKPKVIAKRLRAYVAKRTVKDVEPLFVEE